MSAVPHIIDLTEESRHDTPSLTSGSATAPNVIDGGDASADTSIMEEDETNETSILPHVKLTSPQPPSTSLLPPQPPQSQPQPMSSQSQFQSGQPETLSAATLASAVPISLTRAKRVAIPKVIELSLSDCPPGSEVYAPRKLSKTHFSRTWCRVLKHDPRGQLSIEVPGEAMQPLTLRKLASHTALSEEEITLGKAALVRCKVKEEPESSLAENAAEQQDGLVHIVAEQTMGVVGTLNSVTLLLKGKGRFHAPLQSSIFLPLASQIPTQAKATSLTSRANPTIKCGFDRDCILPDRHHGLCQVLAVPPRKRGTPERLVDTMLQEAALREEKQRDKQRVHSCVTQEDMVGVDDTRACADKLQNQAPTQAMPQHQDPDLECPICHEMYHLDGHQPVDLKCDCHLTVGQTCAQRYLQAKSACPVCG